MGSSSSPPRPLLPQSCAACVPLPCRGWFAIGEPASLQLHHSPPPPPPPTIPPLCTLRRCSALVPDLWEFSVLFLKGICSPPYRCAGPAWLSRPSSCSIALSVNSLCCRYLPQANTNRRRQRFRAKPYGIQSPVLLSPPQGHSVIEARVSWLHEGCLLPQLPVFYSNYRKLPSTRSVLFHAAPIE